MYDKGTVSSIGEYKELLYTGISINWRNVTMIGHFEADKPEDDFVLVHFVNGDRVRYTGREHVMTLIRQMEAAR